GGRASVKRQVHGSGAHRLSVWRPGSKRERPAGECRPLKPTRTRLADVLPGLRLVGSRRTDDMDEVLHAVDARDLEHGLLDGRDLKRVVDLAANRDDRGGDVKIDLALRKVRIAEHLALDPVAQGKVVDRACP